MGHTKFEDYCGLNHGTISDIKVNGPSAANVTKIAVKCPELNLNWLFRGEGQMLNPATPATTEQKPTVEVHHIQTINIGNWKELVELIKDK
jgi:hypothetical protein